MLPLIIDWTNPKAKLGLYFTVHDALYLPSWKCYHVPSEAEQLAIYKLAMTMDHIRTLLAKPISVSCWIRPHKANIPGHANNGQDYNKFIGSTAVKSAHITGEAVDFTVKDMACDDVRAILLPKIDEYKIRLEDKAGSSWIHIDHKWVKNGKNYFKG